MIEYARITAVVALLLTGLHASAQTPDQLQLLNALSPEQRQQVLEQVMGESGSGGTEVPEFPPLMMDDSLSTDLLVEMLTPEEPRVEGDSKIVVRLGFDEELSPERRVEIERALHPRVAGLLGASFFELDRQGRLIIDDFHVVPLAGLTAEEAAIRIQAEPGFRDLEVEVSLLPLEPEGADSLVRFGAELFEGSPTTFAPATDIPVPTDYVVGPGDTVILQMYGKENQRYELAITRDGVLHVPEIGPINVTGLRFSDLRSELQTRIREQMIGVEASVTLGELRSIRVFVLGEAVQPGSYTVSGLSTITNALFFSGGINERGSLRNIQLKRNGRTVRVLDLYRLLLTGDTRADLRLQPGDAIFIPPVGKTVGVGGEVLRPALYELRDEKTAADIIELAGGLLPSALPYSGRLERIGPDSRRTVVDVDLSSNQGRQTRLNNGDVLWVEPVLDELAVAVTVSGHVQRPGVRQYTRGMRLSQLIRDSAELRARADLRYVLIRRETGADRLLEVFSADLSQAWANRGSSMDPALQPRDEVLVFSIDQGRAERIEPLLQQLRQQSRSGEPAREVIVGGRINAAGSYPLESGMRISDLVRAGGGLQEAAYTLNAELTRYDVSGRESRQTELLSIDLQRALAGDPGADIALQSYDNLIIKELPQWQVQESVEIRGEVRFPGTYILQRGEKLSSVLQRAGGLTELAFPDGSVFVREDLKRREQEQIENLAARLEADIVAFSLRAVQTEANAAQALTIGQSLLTQLRKTSASGRLVIDVSATLQARGDANLDVVMRDGDRLFIPKRTQEVTVLGEVQYSTSHIYEPSLSRDEYIRRSGGLTNKADKRRIYVVRANGAVLSGARSRWFQRPESTEIRPGDTVVVPLDADRMSSLALWTNVSQIVYQLALAAASANAVGVF
ncbi:MAG: hypothetical protein HKO55_02170 [Gammaproteobacteria bacterium]|nr:hypothetical protein [Gammaproteobacteria bacterium]NNM20064.1 hypothetical protein [Gammaproteobacteria bacterium]